MKVRVTEAALAALWERGGLLGRGLLTREGRVVRVIHPGTPGDGRGPDFAGATVVWEGGTRVRGDVELHVGSQGWRQHGHDHDPRYNGVVLHVVFRDDSSEPAMLEDGRVVPVLSLEHCLGRNAAVEVATLASRSLFEPPCYGAVAVMEEVSLGQRLSSLGEERFRVKAGDFSAALAEKGPGQAWYTGVMVALGYARNTVPCAELASRLPLAALEGVSGVAERQALLLGTAGLLPSQRHNLSDWDPWVQELERAWQRLGQGTRMRAGRWEFFRVRPANYPPRRLAAMGHLAGGWREGVLAGLLGLVERAVNGGGSRALEAGLMVQGDGYWLGHQDFGLRCEPAALVGRDRAAEVVVNVLLPFAFAWGLEQRQLSLQCAALELYHSYPALAENRVTRRLRAWLWGDDRGPRLSASQQQGLMHLWRAFCGLERCGACPLSR